MKGFISASLLQLTREHYSLYKSLRLCAVADEGTAIIRECRRMVADTVHGFEVCQIWDCE